MMRRSAFLTIALSILTAAATNPTLVIVPGAWHSPIHYSLLIPLLHATGYPTVSLRLPSVNSTHPKDVSVTTDTDYIQTQELLPLLNKGKDVVVVAHSYGGSPGAAAAKGLSKAERKAAGLPGGIIGLVFIAALLAPEGVSLKQAVGGKFNDWVIVNETSGQLGYTTPNQIFYNDVDPRVAQQAISKLRPESENALSTGSPPPAWADRAFTGRLAYVHTLLDNCIPAFAQNLMLNATGVDFAVVNFNTSHSPFLSQPDHLSTTIVGFIRKFVALG